jgi:hypothetical protein
MGLKIHTIAPSYRHPPDQGGQGGSSAKYIVNLIVISYLELSLRFKKSQDQTDDD